MIDVEALLVVQALTEKVEKLEAVNDKLARMYDAREAEVQELLRERNAIERRAAQVRVGWRGADGWTPAQVTDYLLGAADLP